MQKILILKTTANNIYTSLTTEFGYIYKTNTIQLNFYFDLNIFGILITEFIINYIRLFDNNFC